MEKTEREPDHNDYRKNKSENQDEPVILTLPFTEQSSVNEHSQ